MNKNDNKNKTNTQFSKNSSFQDKYTQQSQFFFFHEFKKIKKLSKVTLNIEQKKM